MKLTAEMFLEVLEAERRGAAEGRTVSQSIGDGMAALERAMQKAADQAESRAKLKREGGAYRGPSTGSELTVPLAEVQKSYTDPLRYRVLVYTGEDGQLAQRIKLVAERMLRNAEAGKAGGDVEIVPDRVRYPDYAKLYGEPPLPEENRDGEPAPDAKAALGVGTYTAGGALRAGEPVVLATGGFVVSYGPSSGLPVLGWAAEDAAARDRVVIKLVPPPLRSYPGELTFDEQRDRATRLEDLPGTPTLAGVLSAIAIDPEGRPRWLRQDGSYVRAEMCIDLTNRLKAAGHEGWHQPVYAALWRGRGDTYASQNPDVGYRMLSKLSPDVREKVKTVHGPGGPYFVLRQEDGPGPALVGEEGIKRMEDRAAELRTEQPEDDVVDATIYPSATWYGVSGQWMVRINFGSDEIEAGNWVRALASFSILDDEDGEWFATVQFASHQRETAKQWAEAINKGEDAALTPAGWKAYSADIQPFKRAAGTRIWKGQLVSEGTDPDTVVPAPHGSRYIGRATHNARKGEWLTLTPETGMYGQLV